MFGNLSQEWYDFIITNQNNFDWGSVYFPPIYQNAKFIQEFEGWEYKAQTQIPWIRLVKYEPNEAERTRQREELMATWPCMQRKKK